LSDARKAINEAEEGRFPNHEDVSQYADSVYLSTNSKLIASDNFNNNLKKTLSLPDTI